MNFKLLLFAAISIGLQVSSARSAEPPVTALAFAPDGNSVIACSQSGLQVYSWPELDQQKQLKVSAINLHDIAFSPSGDRLAVGGGSPAEDGSVEILSWPSGKSLQVLRNHSDSVTSVAWRDDSSLASASLDSTVNIWDLKTEKPILTLSGHSRGVSSICFLPDQNTLVTTGIDQSLRVWNSDSAEQIHGLIIHTQPVHDLATRPVSEGLSMVASASADRTVRLWQPTIGRMVRFAKLKSIPLNVAWLANGSKVAACCTNGHVYVIDPDTVEVTHDIPVVDGWAYSMGVHPTDGTLAVGGSDGQLRRIKIE
ncbi:MAG: WD40 repeat domain-containing protein [Pirellulales bacterium]